MDTSELIRVKNNNKSKENWDFSNNLYDPYIDPQKKTQKYSNFAKICFDAVSPFINTRDAGIHDGENPIHLITKIDWEINSKYWIEKSRMN